MRFRVCGLGFRVGSRLLGSGLRAFFSGVAASCNTCATSTHGFDQAMYREKSVYAHICI